MSASPSLTLVIGNKNYSSWSLRAWLLLSAFDLKFTEIRVPLSTESSHAELLRYSRAGRVPVLLDGELVIWDSLAICEYVNEKFLAGRGWPELIAARSQGRSAVAEMHSGFETLRSRMPMNCRAVNRKIALDEPLQADIRRIDELWCELRDDFSTAGPWLLGQFSIADCFFAPVASRFSTYGVPLSESADAYRQILMAHPMMQRWMQAAKAEVEVIELEEKGRNGA